jgi:hypothetical protein
MIKMINSTDLFTMELGFILTTQLKIDILSKTTQSKKKKKIIILIIIIFFLGDVWKVFHSHKIFRNYLNWFICNGAGLYTDYTKLKMDILSKKTQTQGKEKKNSKFFW